MAIVRIGRSRLPPELIRCLATSGIIVTSDPVRDRIAPLTRSMSDETRSTRASSEVLPWLSNGTTTAKIFTPGGEGQGKHRNGMLARQGHRPSKDRDAAPEWRETRRSRHAARRRG